MMIRSVHFPRFAFGFGLVILSATAALVTAQQPAGKLTLKDAIDLALERQPAIRAAQADLSGADVQRCAAYALTSNLGGPQIIVRRKQADLGVSLAFAGVERAKADTIQAVSRTFVTVIYATAQVQVAADAHAKLKAAYDTANRLVEGGSKQVTKNDLKRIETYTLLAETRLNEARIGINRAKAALREAIGLEWDAPLELAADDLHRYVDEVQRFAKEHHAHLSCDKAVTIALAERADYRQAQHFAEIVRLEIDAQKLTLQPYARTFAATADIHAPILPATVINGDYRPGPVGPEMPVELAGSCSARTERAGWYHERALAVVDKARGLVALQVKETCERLMQESKQVELLDKASKAAAEAAKKAEEAYRGDQLGTDALLTAQVVDAQTRGQLNEALFRHATALAALQNATAGQLWDCFESDAAKSPAKEK